jgi:excinuclease ABC subunit A
VWCQHDEDTIRRAHHVIDLGPGAGQARRPVIAEGTAADLMQHPDSLTGRSWSPPFHPLQPCRWAPRAHPAWRR